MCEANFFTISIADQLDGLFQHSHHSQSEEIHFDQPQVGTILLVPLHHHPPRHGSWLEWNNGIKLALTNHHTPGMLAQMARQMQNRLIELKELFNPGIA